MIDEIENQPSENSVIDANRRQILAVADDLRTWAWGKPWQVKARAKSIADNLVLIAKNPDLACPGFNRMMAGCVADLAHFHDLGGAAN